MVNLITSAIFCQIQLIIALNLSIGPLNPIRCLHLNPMTFKDPETGEFLPTWIEYYEKLGVEIPEGQPGCNPNGLASSDKLIRLGLVE